MLRWMWFCSYDLVRDSGWGDGPGLVGWLSVGMVGVLREKGNEGWEEIRVVQAHELAMPAAFRNQKYKEVKFVF